MEREKLFHDFLGKSLSQAFPHAMAALTSPKINESLAPLIPQVERELLMKLPKASANTMGCLRAGLWLLADDLDTAHKLCQDVPTSIGSAWHAHLHRREGDFWNSNYWWRRVSGIAWKLPEGELSAAVMELLTHAEGAEAKRWGEKLACGYDPTEFVGQVERAEDVRDAWGDVLRAVQRLEWLALFVASVEAAK